MPTYEYVCRACDHEFDLFQSMTAPVKRKCPECGRLKLERKFGTGAAVLFKGSGFYETDYRSESYRKAAEADRKGGESGKESTTSDAKSGSEGGTKSSDSKSSSSSQKKSSKPEKGSSSSRDTS